MVMVIIYYVYYIIYSLSLDDPQMSSGWTSLVEAYNNYDDYCYSNECLSFVPSTGASLPKPGMETIYNACQDLNPSMPGRPRRDVSWLREQIKDLRKQVTRVYDNYKRSRHCVSLLRYDMRLYIYITPTYSSNSFHEAGQGSKMRRIDTTSGRSSARLFPLRCGTPYAS
jgi:hypothetical protein